MTESYSEDGGSGFPLELRELYGDTLSTPLSELAPPWDP